MEKSKESETERLHAALVREELAIFAAVMERRLLEKDEARGRRGWREAEASHLLEDLDGAIDLLTARVADGEAVGAIAKAADVANFAMMVADVTALEHGDGLRAQISSQGLEQSPPVEVARGLSRNAVRVKVTGLGGRDGAGERTMVVERTEVGSVRFALSREMSGGLECESAAIEIGIAPDQVDDLVRWLTTEEPAPSGKEG